jgi:hypothetical protein
VIEILENRSESCLHGIPVAWLDEIAWIDL